jgi:alkyldihydroxyacetonephosphate synthase
MSGARLKHYGWGREREGMTAEEQGFVLGRYRAKFARDAFETKVVSRLEDLALRAPRVAPPASLALSARAKATDLGSVKRFCHKAQQTLCGEL